tara:strand:+ start:129 stop:590 length:462 start_codon:yes stop_codon:yes gene_type:complete
MKPRLYDIINTFDKTSKQLNERADTDVDLRVAMTQKTEHNSISVQQYRIDVQSKPFAGQNKNFYYIYEHNELLYEDVALFESAMGIVKNLMRNKSQRVTEIEKADVSYNNALYEVYMYKTKAKKQINEDVMLAKLSQAQNRLHNAKQQILKKL